MQMLRRLIRNTRREAHELLQSSTSAHTIARGAAIGTFIGIMPTPGIGLLLGVLVAAFYKKANAFAVFAGMALWNIFTLPPLYMLSYNLGNFLLGSNPVVEYQVTIAEQVYHYTKRFLLGTTIIAPIIAAVVYVAVLHAVQLWRKRRTSAAKQNRER
jgi:uncharacterized protein